MPVITLTTDLGNKDFYVPLAKGLLLSHVPAANITDITHAVEPFNVGEAAFIIKGCYKAFPKGTIHIISVDSEQEMKPQFLCVQTANHYFLCFDNGLISLLFDDENPGLVQQVVSLSFSAEDLVFPLNNIFIPAAIKLINGTPVTELGSTTNYRRRAGLLPVIEESIIRASVTYIDNFGNAFTNLSRADIERYGRGRNFRIFISRREYFEEINTHYGEVPEGEKLCLFNSTGYLEIAINKGNAAGLLGLRIGSTVLVEFE